MTQIFEWDEAFRNVVAEVDLELAHGIALILHLRDVHRFDERAEWVKTFPGRGPSADAQAWLLASHEQLHEYGRGFVLCPRCECMVEPLHVRRSWC